MADNVAWLDAQPEATREWLGLIFRVGSLLAAFLGLRWLVERSALIPETAYFNHSFLADALRVGTPLFLLLAAVSAGLAVRGRANQFWMEWEAWEGGRSLRMLTVVIVCVLVWMYALYDYNLYFDHGHYIERALLVCFAALALWRPVFLVLFLWLLFSIDGQFEYPFGDRFGQPIPNLLQQVLVMVAAAQLLAALTSIRKTDALLMLILCLIASHYFYPGFRKLNIGWYVNNQVGLFFVAAQAHGWLSFFGTEVKQALVSFFESVNVVMLLCTMVVELGSIAILASRRWAVFIFWSWAVFHLGVFLVSGFFFWQWMALEIGMVFLFLRRSATERANVFGKSYVAIGVVLIATGSLWIRPPALAWFDTGLDYYYEFEAVLESGEARRLSPEFFAPYRDVFAFSAFNYAVEDSQLVTAYGATGSWPVAKRIYEAETASHIFELERSAPHSGVAARRLDRLKRGVARMVEAAPLRQREKAALGLLDALPTFWTWEDDYPLTDLASARSVRVIRITTFYEAKQIKVIDRKQAFEFALDGQGKAPVPSETPQMGDGDP